jgi:pantothenate kinase
MQIQAQLHVKSEIAESFPSRPDRVQEAANAALEAMREIAAERHRRVSEAPRLAEIRDTKLGLVELTFVADTESD